MTHTVRAAVLPQVGAPLEITEVELPDPGPGQVRVKLAAAGVCHSDLSLRDGTLRQPVPAVLGHEGAGTVLATGEGVTAFVPGDQAVLNWAPSCGTCHFCVQLSEPWLCPHANAAATTAYARDVHGTELYPALSVAAFAEETVVSQRALLPLPKGVPLVDAALLGCAVITGYGATRHNARVAAGESVVVVGLGGVGLAVLQAARIAGASKVIAVDASPYEEDLARAAGATDFVLASHRSGKEIRALTDGLGADVAIECVGRKETIRGAWDSTRRGGRTTVVGIGGRDERVEFGALELFYFARTLSGCVYGNCDPARELPVLAEYVTGGELDLGMMVTDRIPLERLPEVFEARGRGRGGRTLVEF